MNDNVTRFSDRVENYLKFRPDYPAKVTEFLLGERSRSADFTLVDLGSGTGKLTRLFLDKGIRAYGVEPNREMREAAESLFSQYSGFVSVEGTGEDSGLEDACADLITIGQALHWFDLDKAREECRRLLKAGGRVAVVYNERSTRSPLLKDYEALLHEHARNYAEVNHRNIDDSAFEQFFGGPDFTLLETDNHQLFDFESFLGRYSSSSYAYQEGDEAFPAARIALRNLFKRYQNKGYIKFEYQTRVYVSALS